ncbi:MAG TPA: hypothetical protein VHD32_12440 [Candidatus Didemnitutus sp.]|nr:hypothetical protein [Candidatus Didemnitutus sp.]
MLELAGSLAGLDASVEELHDGGCFSSKSVSASRMTDLAGCELAGAPAPWWNAVSSTR